MSTIPVMKNITRCELNTNAFAGWRVAISRGSQRYVKYFSDLQYGDKEKSFAAAIEKRDKIYEAFAQATEGKTSSYKEKRSACGNVLLLINEKENGCKQSSQSSSYHSVTARGTDSSVHIGALENKPWQGHATKRGPKKNITRFTQEKNTFAGYRLIITRAGYSFLRYLPDYAYGSQEEAYAASIWCRDIIRDKLEDINNACSNMDKQSRKSALRKFLMSIMATPTVEFASIADIDPVVYISGTAE